jgi:hypothetical protein
MFPKRDYTVTHAADSQALRPAVGVGVRFAKLLVLEAAGRSKSNLPMWLCRCDCGKELAVIQYNLTRGNSTSCGCYKNEKAAARMKVLNFKHGQTNTDLFNIWSGIIERTTNKSHTAYRRYGGRGIALHESWRDFPTFKIAVGERPSTLHSIERIDNNKGYVPGNVRWATMAEQAKNRSTNRLVIVGGQPMILVDAAKALGISKSTASRWLQLGRLVEVGK